MAGSICTTIQKKIGEIIKTCYIDTLDSYNSHKLYAKDLQFQFCRTLLLRCLKMGVPDEIDSNEIDDIFEKTIKDVLIYFKSKIISEEFQTDNQDQEERFELDEQRQLKYKGFLQENGLEFKLSSSLFNKDSEPELDRQVTEHTVKIFRFLEEKAEATIAAFKRKIADTNADQLPVLQIEKDSIRQTNWIKNTGLGQNSKSLGGSLSENTLKLIHLWISHLDKKIQQLEDCDATPIVLSTRSRNHVNIQPMAIERRRLRSLLAEAKAEYESEREEKVSFSEVFKKVKSLDPDSCSEEEDFLVGYCAAMCRNFIKNQAVDLLKIRLKVLLYVQDKFNLQVDMDRKVSLVGFECFGAVEVSCDLQEKFKSHLEASNLESSFEGDAKGYQLEKNLDQLGRKTTTVNVLFRWQEKSTSENDNVSKVPTYYPVRLVVHRVENTKDGQTKPSPTTELSNPKMVLRKAIEAMLKHKINVVSSWIDTVCLRRTEFVNRYDTILKNMRSHIDRDGIPIEVKLKEDSVHIQDYKERPIDFWYLCAYCPMIVEKSHKQIKTFKHNTESRHICQWCILQRLSPRDQQIFLLGEDLSGDNMGGLVDASFDIRKKNEDDASDANTLQDVSGVFKAISHQLEKPVKVFDEISRQQVEERSEKVTYAVGIEANGEKRLYRAFIDQETEELTLCGNFTEYAEVFVKPASINFKAVYVLKTEGLKQAPYWNFVCEEVKDQLKKCEIPIVYKNPPTANQKIQVQQLEKLEMGYKSMGQANPQLKLWQWTPHKSKLQKWNENALRELSERQKNQTFQNRIRALKVLQLLYLDLSPQKIVLDYFRTSVLIDPKLQDHAQTEQQRVMASVFRMSASLLCAQNELSKMVKENRRGEFESYEHVETKKYEKTINQSYPVRNVRWLYLFPHVTNIQLTSVKVEKRMSIFGKFPFLRIIKLQGFEKKQESSPSKTQVKPPSKTEATQSNIIELKQINLGRAYTPVLDKLELINFPSLDKVILDKVISSQNSTLDKVTIVNCGIATLDFLDLRTRNNKSEKSSLQICSNNRLSKVSTSLISRFQTCKLQNNEVLDISSVLCGQIPKEYKLQHLFVQIDKIDPVTSNLMHSDGDESKHWSKVNLYHTDLRQIQMKHCRLSEIVWFGKTWDKIVKICISNNYLATIDLLGHEMPMLNEFDASFNLLETLYLPVVIYKKLKRFKLKIKSNNILKHNLEDIRNISSAQVCDLKKTLSSGFTIENPCSKDQSTFYKLLTWSYQLEKKSG